MTEDPRPHPERVSAATGLPDPLNLALVDLDNPPPPAGTPLAGTDGAYVAGHCGHRVLPAWYESGFSTCNECAWSDLDLRKPGQT